MLLVQAQQELQLESDSKSSLLDQVKTENEELLNRILHQSTEISTLQQSVASLQSNLGSLQTQ